MLLAPRELPNAVNVKCKWTPLGTATGKAIGVSCITNSWQANLFLVQVCTSGILNTSIAIGR